MAAAERSFQFSHVFEHTAEVIVTTYQKLLELQTAVNNYTQPLEPANDPNSMELAKILQTKAKEFSDYYLPNKIYILKSTAEKIREFSNSMMSLARSFAIGESMHRAQVRNVEALEANDKRFLTL